LPALRRNEVCNSIPLEGSTRSCPTDGGPFVLTTTKVRGEEEVMKEKQGMWVRVTVRV
jgi:hypothetical protein